ASHFANATGAKICQRLFGEPIESSRRYILLKPAIEVGSLELVEPGPETSKLIGRQLSHRFFDVFDVSHVVRLTDEASSVIRHRSRDQTKQAIGASPSGTG